MDKKKSTMWNEMFLTLESLNIRNRICMFYQKGFFFFVVGFQTGLLVNDKY